jgi:hypothetical protein
MRGGSPDGFNNEMQWWKPERVWEFAPSVEAINISCKILPQLSPAYLNYIACFRVLQGFFDAICRQYARVYPSFEALDRRIRGYTAIVSKLGIRL